MPRHTSSIGRSPLVATEARRSNSGARLLLVPRRTCGGVTLMFTAAGMQTGKPHRGAARERFRRLVADPAVAAAVAPTRAFGADRAPRRQDSIMPISGIPEIGRAARQRRQSPLSRGQGFTQSAYADCFAEEKTCSTPRSACAGRATTPWRRARASRSISRRRAASTASTSCRSRRGSRPATARRPGA
jgi:hypothetical protein